MRRPTEQSGTRIVKDVLWLAIGAFFLFGLLRGVFGLLSGGGRATGAGLLWLIPGVLVTYWIGMGAIRRTSWMQRRHQMRQEHERARLDEEDDSTSAG